MITYALASLGIIYFMKGCEQETNDPSTEFKKFYYSLIHANQTKFLSDISTLLQKYNIQILINASNINDDETLQKIIDELNKLKYHNLNEIKKEYNMILKKYDSKKI